MSTRRYLVTVNNDYYPSYGLDDVEGDFYTKEEAEAFAEFALEQRGEFCEVRIHDLDHTPWRGNELLRTFYKEKEKQ